MGLGVVVFNAKCFAREKPCKCFKCMHMHLYLISRHFGNGKCVCLNMTLILSVLPKSVQSWKISAKQFDITCNFQFIVTYMNVKFNSNNNNNDNNNNKLGKMRILNEKSFSIFL